jgi:hypothetical protein
MQIHTIQNKVPIIIRKLLYKKMLMFYFKEFIFENFSGEFGNEELCVEEKNTDKEEIKIYHRVVRHLLILLGISLKGYYLIENTFALSFQIIAVNNFRYCNLIQISFHIMVNRMYNLNITHYI